MKGATRDGDDIYGYLVDISIHAPVKGATRKGFAGDLSGSISIHAPVKGATEGHPNNYYLDTTFQSTHP